MVNTYLEKQSFYVWRYWRIFFVRFIAIVYRGYAGLILHTCVLTYLNKNDLMNIFKITEYLCRVYNITDYRIYVPSVQYYR